MKKVNLLSRTDFFFILGFSIVFLHIPFFFLIQNSSGATVMPAWNWVTISVILILNYIIIPFILYLCLCVFNLVKLSYKKLFLSVCIAYAIIIQICFYVLPSISNKFEALVILVFVPILSIILYRLFQQVLLIKGAIGLTFPISLICFLYLSYPINFENSQSQELSSINGQNDIVIITTEKLTSPLMLNEDGVIRDEFPNLQRLEKLSTIYTDLHARTIHTAGGINAILTGHIGTNNTPKGMHSFRSRDILSSGSIIDIFSSGRKVHIYNDYTGERYCDEKKHHCIKIFNQTSIGPTVKIVLAFYWEYIDSLLPKGILRRVKEKQLAFFEDILVIDNDPTKYPKMQFDKFLKDYEEAEIPVLMVMHTFMTDGGFSKPRGYSESDMSMSEINKWNRIKIFDSYIGKLIDKMQKKGKLEESLLLIISDTGSDVVSMNKMTKPNINTLKYNNNISNIFGMLHRPNQKSGFINKKRIFQENIYEKLIAGYEKKDLKINLQNTLKLEAKSSVGLRMFILNNKTNKLELNIDND